MSPQLLLLLGADMKAAGDQLLEQENCTKRQEFNAIGSMLVLRMRIDKEKSQHQQKLSETWG